MKGYAEAEIFKPREIELFKTATTLIEYVPDKVNGEVVRCHELARAFSKLLDIPYEDGRYCFIEHTWLWTRPLERAFATSEKWELPPLLDVYMPGQMPQVQLLDVMSHAMPHEYRPGLPRDDIDEEIVEGIYRLIAPLAGPR